MILPLQTTKNTALCELSVPTRETKTFTPFRNSTVSYLFWKKIGYCTIFPRNSCPSKIVPFELGPPSSLRQSSIFCSLCERRRKARGGKRGMARKEGATGTFSLPSCSAPASPAFSTWHTGYVFWTKVKQHSKLILTAEKNQSQQEQITQKTGIFLCPIFRFETNLGQGLKKSASFVC